MTLLSGSGGTKLTRLGKHQRFSLDYVCKQVFEFKHRNSYIETSKGWGKPHEGRVIASLVEKGLINCWSDSLFEVKLSNWMIPNDGAFFAMPTKLGRTIWLSLRRLENDN